MLGFFFYVTMVLFIIVCSFLMLVILIQKGRGGGLASAFGGGGGNTAFGSKTGDVLTWATSIVFGIFLILSVATNLTANKIHWNRTHPTGQETEKQAPAAPASENPLETGTAPATGN